MSWVDVTGYVASVLVFCTFYMKTMIPLRVVGILSNVVFMAYGAGGRLYPVLILHAILLPLNCVRVIKMQTLAKKARDAATGDCSTECLIPYMQSRTLKKGVLFRKGDAADEMYLLLKGSVRLMDVGVTIHPGTLIDEIGIFAPSRQRMDTAICESDVEVAAISYDRVRQLYHQNPKVGFYLINLATDQLLQNLSRTQRAAGNARYRMDAGARAMNASCYRPTAVSAARSKERFTGLRCRNPSRKDSGTLKRATALIQSTPSRKARPASSGSNLRSSS
jgi:CRP-like cAMP-binding protein